jgi:general secretion pathway protein L
MADTLIIRLASDRQGLQDWLLVDEQGQIRTPVQPGAPAPAIAAAARRTVVLVPGGAVSLLEARVPMRNRQRVLRAVPFALEERLAEDVERLHFALGNTLGDNRYPVAVVERARMDDWLGQLREQGISADQMVPETLALPAGDGWSLLLDGDRVLVRSGDYAGFGCDADSLPALVSLFAAREQLPQTARTFGASLFDIEGVDVELDDTQLPALEIMARGLAQGPVLDLLQASYSRREEWGRLLGPWKATAALFLACVVLGGITTGLNYHHLGNQQALLESRIQELYKQTFPNTRRIVNPRAQMEQELKQLQRASGAGGTDFLGMFAATAQVVRASTGISVQAASYRDGRLDLDLRADTLQVLDGFKQALVSDGRVQAEIQSATTENDQTIKSRIHIEVKGS